MRKRAARNDDSGLLLATPSSVPRDILLFSTPPCTATAICQGALLYFKARPPAKVSLLLERSDDDEVLP
ncbi:hypothetical protein D3C81_1943220 [compost metagenome]